MKLNTKRTLLVGFAFFGICAFWQLYDNIITLILKFDFGVSDRASGWVMSLDNIFALVLLPIFGALSDKTRTRFGKRMPYIFIGTVVAAIAFVLMPAAAEAKRFGFFIVMLLIALLAMSVYRSPAVSLMPDVTPKPLRSKANAIINLMGTVGGLVVLICVSLLMKTEYYAVCENGHRTVIESSAIARYTCEECGVSYEIGDATIGLTHNSYLPLFAVTAGIMLICLAGLLLFVRENRFVKEREEIERSCGLSDDEDYEKTDKGGEKLRPEVRRSLIFLLLSVAFWFMGYNAVTTAFSKYVVWYWNLPNGGFANCLIVALAAAAISYIPIGIVSSKIGRKKTILFGCVLLTAMFGAAFFFRQYHPVINVLFALVGVAWAAINVNSYPMVVEMSRGSNIGRYTGLYYTFSMAAQVVTPILSGYLLDVSYRTLFPYAAAFTALSFVTMLFVRHGDSVVPPKKSLLEHLDVD
ncbi:MAG: MFS transporter, partial [Pyramidobacter sp.]|nr:MFS transporter [Pyramidobacter sp.]